MTAFPPSAGWFRANHPLLQLILARVREFYREPEAVFWVYGFPLLMMLALGIAFRNRPVERFTVAVSRGPAAEHVTRVLSAEPRFKVSTHDAATSFERLRTGKADLVVVATNALPPGYAYHFDPTKPGSLLARHAVDDALQRASGRLDVARTEDVQHQEPGGRYIDFLVPGLLGMGLMGGGLWGVGFVIVDMRIRHLLKRFLATPMRKSHFLAAVMMSRMLFMVTEVAVLLLAAWLIFRVPVRGSLVAIGFLIVFGATMFSGIGLLVASRARTLEAVSGWMNLVMLPMWVLSGIFFSSARFPDLAQPFIKALPLTPLIDALRAVMLDGAALSGLSVELAIIAFWTVSSFVLALRWFRWM